MEQGICPFLFHHLILFLLRGREILNLADEPAARRRTERHWFGFKWNFMYVRFCRG